MSSAWKTFTPRSLRAASSCNISVAGVIGYEPSIAPRCKFLLPPWTPVFGASQINRLSLQLEEHQRPIRNLSSPMTPKIHHDLLGDVLCVGLGSGQLPCEEKEHISMSFQKTFPFTGRSGLGFVCLGLSHTSKAACLCWMMYSLWLKVDFPATREDSRTLPNGDLLTLALWSLAT